MVPASCSLLRLSCDPFDGCGVSVQLCFISIGASSNSPRLGDDFDHLIVHFMACTLEEDDPCDGTWGIEVLEISIENDL